MPSYDTPLVLVKKSHSENPLGFFNVMYEIPEMNPLPEYFEQYHSMLTAFKPADGCSVGCSTKSHGICLIVHGF